MSWIPPQCATRWPSPCQCGVRAASPRRSRCLPGISALCRLLTAPAARHASVCLRLAKQSSVGKAPDWLDRPAMRCPVLILPTWWCDLYRHIGKSMGLPLPCGLVTSCVRGRQDGSPWHPWSPPGHGGGSGFCRADLRRGSSISEANLKSARHLGRWWGVISPTGQTNKYREVNPSPLWL